MQSPAVDVVVGEAVGVGLADGDDELDEHPASAATAKPPATTVSVVFVKVDMQPMLSRPLLTTRA